MGSHRLLTGVQEPLICPRCKKKLRWTRRAGRNLDFLPVFLYNRIGDCHVQDEPEMLPEVQEGFYCGALSEDLWGVQGAKTIKAISQYA